MKQSQLNIFTDVISRSLERPYSSLLAEPVPPRLQALLDRLALAGGPAEERHGSTTSSRTLDAKYLPYLRSLSRIWHSCTGDRIAAPIGESTGTEGSFNLNPEFRLHV